MVIVAGQSTDFSSAKPRVGRDADEAKDPAPLPPEAQHPSTYMAIPLTSACAVGEA